MKAQGMRKGKMLSKIFGIALVILAIFSICGAVPGIVNIESVSGSSAIIYVPDDYTKIQWAVDNATSGDTIIVRDGTYHENVDVSVAHLTIQSENGTANCAVNASNPNDHVFEVTADWVTITGFTVENATGLFVRGIYLDTVSHCNISSNDATNNYYGIYLFSSTNTTLTNNTASNNEYGIYLYHSTNNSLSNNTANSNMGDGIVLWSSSDNTLVSNSASNNTEYGVYLMESTNTTLTNSTASNNEYGIVMSSSSNNNTLTHNTVSNNGDGIYLYSSSNNIIYNNYFNNTNNAHDDGFNTWNTTKQAGANIIGGSWLGGNYWSDYAGSDTNGDGLGDTEIPYNSTGNITNGGDYLPLVSYIDVMRSLPNTVQRGETFNVTVTFTAPADKFNAIGLIDLAPDGWNVTVDAAWCTPNADEVLATGNRAEIAWFGEPGVGFDNGTLFDVLYKVTVPDDTPVGIYTFNGFLAYYLAAGGPYYESITGDFEAEVTPAILEGHVSFYRAEDPGEPTWVTPLVVSFFDNATKLEMDWSPINVTTDAYGNFTIENIEFGTYDVGVKNWTSLSKMTYREDFTASNITNIDFGMLTEGDTDNDDQTKLADFNRILNNFGAKPGDAGWDPNYDFDRSGKVDLVDFNLVLNKFGQKGNLYYYLP